PKALLPYQGRPFLEHLLAVTMHPKIGVRRIVLGKHAEPISAAVRLQPDEIVINERWEDGQLSSIQAAIRTLPAGPPGMGLFPVYHPLISAELVGDLIEGFYSPQNASRTKIVLPLFRGQRGHPVIFSANLYEELLAAPLDRGARAVVWSHEADLLAVET